jgi:hypothetical protein
MARNHALILIEWTSGYGFGVIKDDRIDRKYTGHFCEDDAAMYPRCTDLVDLAERGRRRLSASRPTDRRTLTNILHKSLL